MKAEALYKSAKCYSFSTFKTQHILFQSSFPSYRIQPISLRNDLVYNEAIRENTSVTVRRCDEIWHQHSNFGSQSLLTGTLPFALNAATRERSSSLTLVGTTRTAGYVSQNSYMLLILDIFQLSLGKPLKTKHFYIHQTSIMTDRL